MDSRDRLGARAGAQRPSLRASCLFISRNSCISSPYVCFRIPRFRTTNEPLVLGFRTHRNDIERAVSFAACRCTHDIRTTRPHSRLRSSPSNLCSVCVHRHPGDFLAASDKAAGCLRATTPSAALSCARAACAGRRNCYYQSNHSGDFRCFRMGTLWPCFLLGFSWCDGPRNNSSEANGRSLSRWSNNLLRRSRHCVRNDLRFDAFRSRSAFYLSLGLTADDEICSGIRFRSGLRSSHENAATSFRQLLLSRTI